MNNIMSLEEKKALVALTPEQQGLVQQMNTVIERMKEEKMIIIYDSYYGSFSVINGQKVLEVNDTFEPPKEAEDIEDCPEFGNIKIADITYSYDSCEFNLCAVFGDTSEMNKSMMSAQL